MKVNPAAAIPLPERKPIPAGSASAADGTGSFNAALTDSDVKATPPGIPDRKPDAPPPTAGGLPLPGRKPVQTAALPLPQRKPDAPATGTQTAALPLPQRKPDAPATGTQTAALPLPQRKPELTGHEIAVLPQRKPTPPTSKAESTKTDTAKADVPKTERQRERTSRSETAAIAQPQSRSEMARQIIEASQVAAGPSGHSFKTLVAQASQESEFNIHKKSTLSSAAGPFQFLQGTWLDMFRRHGAAYGLGDLAAKIQVKDGKAYVADPAVRKQILDMRHNVDVAAGMAARMLAEGREKLESRLGRPISENESRIAYIFGVGGAMTLLRAADRNPDTPAAELLPAAAKVNGPLFYDRKTGEPLTVKDALARMARRLNVDHAAMFQAISQAVPPPSQLNGGPSPFNPFQTAADQPAGNTAATVPLQNTAAISDDNAVAAERRPV